MFNNDTPERESTEKFASDFCSIQPDGYLMVLNVNDLKVVQASSNFSKIVVGGAKTIIGQTFEDLFGAPIAANLQRRINKEGRILMLISGDFHLFDQRKFNCFVQTVQDKIIVEMEESTDLADASAEQTSALSEAVATFGKSENINELINVIPQEIKRLTGFERVIVLKLDQMMTGKIIAEDVTDGMQSLLDFQFPAEDITLETCEEYCRTTVRVVSDTGYEPSPMIGEGDAIDLSNCALASVSQVHIDQMRQHGIGASLSISIVCNGRLWGIIACHNRTPMRIHHGLRSYCEVLGKLVSLRISSFEESAQRDLKEKLRRFFDGIREKPTRDSLENELMKNAQTILELFDGKGLALVNQDHVQTYPVAPTQVDISLYTEWLKASGQKTFFIEDNLRSKFPLEGMVETASGVITMSFPAYNLSLHIFRPELKQTFTWASSMFMSSEKGRKRKEKSPTPDEVRQTIERHSAPWTLNQMFMAQVFFDSMKNALAAIDKNAAE